MSEQNPPGDPFEFLKKMWGPMGQSLPGMVTPTLDLNEIEKRINELKSVETWLTMNLNMLKMTIQGLEMQRNTLTAFKSMAEAAQQSGAPDTAAGAPAAPPWPWNLVPQAAPAEPQPKEKAPPGPPPKSKKE